MAQPRAAHADALSRKKQYMRTNCERFPYLVGGFAQYCDVFPLRVAVEGERPDHSNVNAKIKAT